MEEENISDFGKGVGRTSLLIAAWRARESEQVDPLYIDPIANIFSDDALAEELKDVDSVSTSTRHLINYRTRYFDDYLLNEINRGVMQVVILGAGLDTRSLRFLGNGNVRFFEFDQCEVLQFKQRKLERYGYSSPSCFVGGNYINDDFLALLEAKGYDPNIETYFIWEGNSMYIPVPDILAFLQHLKHRVSRFKISFDYLSKGIIDRSTGYEGIKDLLSSFQTMDAPWVTGFDDILPLAKQTNLTVIETKSMADAVMSSTNRVSMDPQLFRYYYLCTLGSD